MILRTVLVTIFAASLTSGCASLQNFLAKTGGKFAGGKAGAYIAANAPTPKATTSADVRGGYFCDVMPKLGWPDKFTREERDALSDESLRPIIAANKHGRQAQCW